MKRRLLALGLLGLVGIAGARRIADALAGAKDAPSPRARTYVFERRHLVQAPLDQVFPFFDNPENLAEITPPEMGFRITRVENLPMQAGTRIEYQIRIFGVPQRWRTDIVEYEPGRRFIDLQAGGPYRYWRHEHAFEAIDSTTLMTDRIEYQLPFGPLGRLAHPLVSRQLNAIFDYRAEVVDRQFSGEQ